MWDSIVSALASGWTVFVYYVETIGTAIGGFFLGLIAVVTTVVILILSGILMCCLIIFATAVFIIGAILTTIFEILKGIIIGALFLATVVIVWIGFILAIVVDSGEALVSAIGRPLGSLMNSTGYDST